MFDSISNTQQLWQILKEDLGDASPYLSQFPFSHLHTHLCTCLGSWILLDSGGPLLLRGKNEGGRLTKSTPIPLLQLISRLQFLLSFISTTPFRFLVSSAATSALPGGLSGHISQILIQEASNLLVTISSACLPAWLYLTSYAHSWAREYQEALWWLSWVLHVLLLPPLLNSTPTSS